MSFKPFCLFLVMIAFASCLGDDKNNADTARKTFTGKNYSIKYPPDWKLDTARKEVDFFLFAPMDLGSILFNENINMMVQPKQNGLPDSTDLQEYVSFSENQIKESGGTLLSSYPMQDSTGEFYIFNYTAKFNGVLLRIIQMVRMREGNAYLLTYTAPPQERDPYKVIADRIFNSFTLK
ncbi:MAG: hypothetical protein M3R17_08935 [Bacteroidota bacterium]|nr:hypothetical protein [Bacteroidota bacterium]